MDRIRIRGGRPLKGEIPISGAKNAALKLMAACLLTSEPLLLSKATFDRIAPEHQKIMLDVGVEMEAYGLREAKKDDDEVARIYGAKGASVADFSTDGLAQWRKIAEDSAWKDYASRSSEAADLLALAKKVS